MYSTLVYIHIHMYELAALILTLHTHTHTHMRAHTLIFNTDAAKTDLNCFTSGCHDDLLYPSSCMTICYIPGDILDIR